MAGLLIPFINESSNSSYIGRDLTIEAKVEILAPISLIPANI